MELKICGLRKTYQSAGRDGGFQLDLPDLVLGIPSVTFVMGHNGSGKSVLLRLLAGDELPSDGNVHIFAPGRAWIANKSPVPIVRQNVNESLALDLTVAENLSLHLRPSSFLAKLAPLRYMKESVEMLLRPNISLKRKIDELCKHLSLGQKQALAFLAVSARKLPLLLLDEFLASTDFATSETLLKSAETYSERTPACVIVVSHDAHIALARAGRILVLRNGRLVHDLTRGHPEWTEWFLADALRQP